MKTLKQAAAQTTEDLPQSVAHQDLSLALAGHRHPLGPSRLLGVVKKRRTSRQIMPAAPR